MVTSVSGNVTATPCPQGASPPVVFNRHALLRRHEKKDSGGDVDVLQACPRSLLEPSGGLLCLFAFACG